MYGERYLNLLAGTNTGDIHTHLTDFLIVVVSLAYVIMRNNVNGTGQQNFIGQHQSHQDFICTVADLFFSAIRQLLIPAVFTVDKVTAKR